MQNISIIGGDKRNFILADLLEQEGYNLFKFGLGTNEKSIEETIKQSKYIITATPFSTDLQNIYSPLTTKKISIQNFIELVHNKIIIAGSISVENINKLKYNKNKVFDIMQDNNLAINNAIPTAEGVIKIIIENTDITINDSNIAILGFGRVGKRIAKVLNGIGAKIFCFDISKEEVENIKISGYNILKNIYKDLSNMDVIVNTIPSQIDTDKKIITNKKSTDINNTISTNTAMNYKKILGKDEIDCINKNTLIIDVSSKPGGVDFEYANKNKYNVIHALGLPGKIAPITSAKYIKDLVKKLIIRGV